MKFEDCKIGTPIILESGREALIIDLDYTDNSICIKAASGGVHWVNGEYIDKAHPKYTKEDPEAFRKEQYFAIMREVITSKINAVISDTSTESLAECALTSIDKAIKHWNENK